MLSLHISLSKVKMTYQKSVRKNADFFAQYLERYTEHSARRTKASLTVCAVTRAPRRAKGCQCQQYEHSASVVGWRGAGAARACGGGWG